mmetsp:Transcript_50657/g.147011  ORF Transcript_50657/g.147011 Transcript_50657/m.147011 type:complete len:232 (-) Transcript_50657:914-1609(-)
MQSGKAKCFSSSLHGHSIRTATMFFCSATATVSSASTQGRVRTPFVRRITKLEELRTALRSSSKSRSSTESRKSSLSRSSCGPSAAPAPKREFRMFRRLGDMSAKRLCDSEVETEDPKPGSASSSSGGSCRMRLSLAPRLRSLTLLGSTENVSTSQRLCSVGGLLLRSAEQPRASRSVGVRNLSRVNECLVSNLLGERGLGESSPPRPRWPKTACVMWSYMMRAASPLSAL